MNEYLLSNTNFALWASYYLLGGAGLCAAWGFSFRRLTRTAIAGPDLLWEARRGLAGGVIWLAMLALIFVLMFTTAEINNAEALGIADPVSDLLLQNMVHGRHIVVLSAVGHFFCAGLVVLVTGVWTGAWRVLRDGNASDARGVHHV